MTSSLTRQDQTELMTWPASLVAVEIERQAVLRSEAKGAPRPERCIENALLTRSDPVIDLALARYAAHAETLAMLFERNPSKAIRVACLSNELPSSVDYQRVPWALYADKKTCLDAISDFDDVELEAIFTNPGISETFLAKFLRRGTWMGLSEGSFVKAICLLSRSPRMSTERGLETADGFMECQYNQVFVEAWDLARTAEPTFKMANALADLYSILVPSYVNDLSAIMAKWDSGRLGEDWTKQEAELNCRGFLGAAQRIRFGLARLSVQAGAFSEDLAIRCFHYRDSWMTPVEIQNAVDRDGGVAMNHLLHNKKLWQNKTTRDSLENLSDRLDGELSTTNFHWQDSFRVLRHSFLQKNQNWFT